MLAVLFGNKNRELVLQYLIAYQEGYAREIAKYLDISLPSVQNLLRDFEDGGFLLSKLSGRTKLYFLNPRYAFLDELKQILEKARLYYKPDLKEKFEMVRLRPRKADKPL